MAKYEALKFAAGRLRFQPGDILDLAADAAEELLTAGAIKELEAKPVVKSVEKPVSPAVVAKKPARRTKATRKPASE